MDFDQTYRGRRVLITGHTGFKGAWLARWAAHLGAEVGGVALDPAPEAEALFGMVSGELALDRRQDVRDAGALAETVRGFEPDFVFHLAAQPLVIESYRDPLTTVATNVSGTANLIDAVRQGAPSAACVVVTTDKCYENLGWAYPYRESDPLGGHDLYSASKAAAEIVTAAFRRSYFESGDVPGRLATARGGNVIGGGDYAADRIVPDTIRSLRLGQPVRVRKPGAIRPWQHVLDCLSGYLTLGAWLATDAAGTMPEHRAFNFGPDTDCERSVAVLVEEFLGHWPGTWEDGSEGDAPHEMSRLRIATDLAQAVLGWRPVWGFEETVRRTVEWYRADTGEAGAPDDLMLQQIDAFTVARASLISA